jgi:tRNA/rRNA methyltransferase
MCERVELANIAIVLHRPRFSENIGAAARAMRNMGIKTLIVVDPQNCDLTRVLKMATHAARGVVEEMRVLDTLEEALAPFHFVVGTTARLGRQRSVIESPAALAQRVMPIARNNQVAVLFGPEDRGLTNEDIRRCQWLVNIPTDEFASLNLAQAVMIICYEFFTSRRNGPVQHVPRLASRHELDGMYAQLKDVLVRICYINPENPDYWMGRIRHFFTRIQVTAKEVSIIRGICRQINWYAEKRYRDGHKDFRDTL